MTVSKGSGPVLATVMPNWVRSAGVIHAAAPATGVVHETFPSPNRVWKIHAERAVVAGGLIPSGGHGAWIVAGARRFAIFRVFLTLPNVWITSPIRPHILAYT